MMTTVSVHEAKTHLSRLIEKVLAGEKVVISRNREPVVQMIPAQAAPMKTRRIGAWKGKISLGERFFEPLPEDELKAWEGD
jgi:prevent-host-death family protein